MKNYREINYFITQTNLLGIDYSRVLDGSGYIVKQSFDIRRTANKLMVPECGVLDQLDKGGQQAPRMRSVYNQAFQKHSGHLLFDSLGLTREQMEERSAKEARVAVGITQMICNGTQQSVAT